jgi:hypothetical protein
MITNNMITILGEQYYIDIEKVQDVISLPEKTTGDTEQNMSLVKFELVKTMIDVLMTENEEVDENLGLKGTLNLSMPFKLAFNTLLVHGILKTL